MRVLVSVFGSAGDLFPLMPVIDSLRRSGHDVRCAVPRSLGPYLRASRVPTYGLGDGTELRVFDDPGIVLTRFDGWASWRSTVTDYVAPVLAKDVATLRKAFAGWRPHLVVATSFAVAARLAAFHERVPVLASSIYPQHQSELRGNRSFARPLRRLVAVLVGLDPDDPAVTRLAWGVGDDTVLLHDRAVLDAGGGYTGPGEVVGFPEWDAGPGHADDLDRLRSWLAASAAPVVLVTLGSFLGVRQRAALAEAATAVKELGVRAVFVGPQRADSAPPLRPGPELMTVGFVPLSQVAHAADVVVHHGGIGTTFATLRAGRPAAVMAQAFDQGYNARLVERAGAGLDARGRGLAPAIARLLGDASAADRVQALAASLVPAGTAASRVVGQVVKLVEQTEGVSS